MKNHSHQDTVLSRIAEAEMISDPFSHFVATNVFDEQYYFSILKNIPDAEDINGLKQIDMGISQSRSIVNVESLNSPFWNDFANRFGGPEFADQVLKKFGKRFDENNYVTTQFVQDKLGYRIGPHTDIDSKKMTILFYLPADDSMQEFGTSICRTLDESLVGSQDHHTWDHFEESHVVLFRPNTAMAFCRTDNSFHAVRTIHESVTRNTISLTIRIR